MIRLSKAQRGVELGTYAPALQLRAASKWGSSACWLRAAAVQKQTGGGVDHLRCATGATDGYV